MVNWAVSVQGRRDVRNLCVSAIKPLMRNDPIGYLTAGYQGPLSLDAQPVKREDLVSIEHSIFGGLPTSPCHSVLRLPDIRGSR